MVWYCWTSHNCLLLWLYNHFRCALCTHVHKSCRNTSDIVVSYIQCVTVCDCVWCDRCLGDPGNTLMFTVCIWTRCVGCWVVTTTSIILGHTSVSVSLAFRVSLPTWCASWALQCAPSGVLVTYAEPVNVFFIVCGCCDVHSLQSAPYMV